MKVKVKLSLCCNWVPRHEGVLREWKYSSTHSLTSALYRGYWSASRPGRFTPRDTAPGTHWKGGWVGPRAGPDAVVKRKIPSPHNMEKTERYMPRAGFEPSVTVFERSKTCKRLGSPWFIFTYTYTRVQTKYSQSSFLEESTVTQLVKKYPTCMGPKRLIIVFTKSIHSTVPWASWIQSIYIQTYAFEG
jgi:hypothetical protein